MLIASTRNVLICAILLFISSANAQKKGIGNDVEDYSKGYAFAFFFNDTSIPSGTCANELTRLRKAMLPAYANNLVRETSWNTSDVLSFAPTLASALPKDPGNQRQLLRQKRRLPALCKGKPCSSWSAQLIMSFGCSAICSGANANVAPADIGARRDLQSSLAYGKRSQMLGGLGDLTIKSLYDWAELNIPSPCKEIILSMKYLETPMTLE